MNRPNLQKRPEEEFRVTLKGSLIKDNRNRTKLKHKTHPLDTPRIWQLKFSSLY